MKRCIVEDCDISNCKVTTCMWHSNGSSDNCFYTQNMTEIIMLEEKKITRKKLRQEKRSAIANIKLLIIRDRYYEYLLDRGLRKIHLGEDELKKVIRIARKQKFKIKRKLGKGFIIQAVDKDIFKMFKFDSETGKDIPLYEVLGISKKQLAILRSLITSGEKHESTSI